MAVFKVGQRVRIVSAELVREALGREATITGFAGIDDYKIDIDGMPLVKGTYTALAHELAPLTPPEESTWAADKVRQITKPLHTEPTVTKEHV